MNRRLKLNIYYDLYTNQYLSIKSRSIEHIIPQRLFDIDYMKNDVQNLWIVDQKINRFRSDYRFGGSLQEIYENKKEWQNLNDYVFRNKKKRIFYPVYGHHIIAKTCLNMRYKYPIINNYWDQIVISENLFDDWIKKPKTIIDKEIENLKMDAIRIRKFF